MKTLFVGSREWGKPRPDSDFDIVVCPETPAELAALTAAGVFKDSKEKNEYDYADDAELIDAAVRTGPFNLIVVKTAAQFSVWAEARNLLAAECKQRGKIGTGYVTRERAVQVLQALAKGDPVPEPSSPEVTNREQEAQAWDAQAINCLGLVEGAPPAS